MSHTNFTASPVIKIIVLSFHVPPILYFICCGHPGKLQTNSDMYSINVRYKHDLHVPIADFAMYQKGCFIQNQVVYLNNVELFISALKDYLFCYLFNLLQEFTLIGKF